MSRTRRRWRFMPLNAKINGCQAKWTALNRQKRDDDQDQHDHHAKDCGPSLAFKIIEDIEQSAHQPPSPIGVGFWFAKEFLNHHLHLAPAYHAA